MERDFVSNNFFSGNARYGNIIYGNGCGGIPFIQEKIYRRGNGCIGSIKLFRKSVILEKPM